MLICNLLNKIEMINSTLEKLYIENIWEYCSTQKNINKDLLARRLCIILLLDKTNLNLKEVLNLSVLNVKELESKQKTFVATEKNLLKEITLKQPLSENKILLSNMLEKIYANKENDDYAFTTISNPKKPLYTSNVRKELTAVLYNLATETQFRLDLTHLINDKIMS